MKAFTQKLEDILTAAAFSEAAEFDHALQLLGWSSSEGNHEALSGSSLITEACP